MSVGIYELYKDNKLMGEFTSKEIAEITGYKSTTITAKAKYGCTFGKCYKVVKVDTQLTLGDMPLLIDFEFAARKLLRLSGGKI